MLVSGRTWIGGLLVLACAAAYAATSAGAANDHPLTTIALYTLVLLGEVSNMLGMGRTMTGAVAVTYGLYALTALYGVFGLIFPAINRRTMPRL